ARPKAEGTDRSFPPHIGTRWRCFVLLCSQARAEPAALPRHGWTHQPDRTAIGTLSGGLSSAAAPRRKKQQIAAWRQRGRQLFLCSSRLPNYLIRSRQHVRRNRESDLLCRFQINAKVELHRLLYRNIGRLRPFENFVHVDSRTPV